MKRKMFLILVIVAAGLYSYIAYLLGGGSITPFAKKDVVNGEKTVSLDKLVLNSVAVHFEKSDRDPFLPYKEKPVNLEKSKEIHTAIPKKEPPKPPSIIITGIMWNPTSPVAMVTMPSGTSTIAKVGTTVDSITFKKIEKNRIYVSRAGKEFWINR